MKLIDDRLICPLCGNKLTVEIREDTDYNYISRAPEAYLDCWCDACQVVEFCTNNVKEDTSDFKEKLAGYAIDIIENAKSLKRQEHVRKQSLI